MQILNFSSNQCVLGTIFFISVCLGPWALEFLPLGLSEDTKAGRRKRKDQDSLDVTL